MTLIPAIIWFQTCKAETFINNSAMTIHLGWFNEALNIMLLALLVFYIIFNIIYKNVGIKYSVINYLLLKLDWYLESSNFK